ncbi:hypothetical protein JZO84_00960 [Enterococcus plantarum]|nr:hypothetical protein [Enterococcus plantarum]MBO0421457.1 hypothetical protein [Enterococcus plantarum]
MTIKRVWWKVAVGYQIYLASFMDTSNDVIVDINGIRSKLDYLKELSIGFIWVKSIKWTAEEYAVFKEKPLDGYQSK